MVITISGQVIPVAGITVTGAGWSNNNHRDNGTLALTATVTPANATNKSVTWSITNGTGQATISSTGLVTAVADGTVTARATA
ncbi:MAG: Ig-like domain-containing protein, partial [Bacteroidales bacterium]|nr:Ig-like domain-containing protein [Bacteroidales bacterium]